MFDLNNFEHTLIQTFNQIKKDQAEALNIQIAANFIAGMNAAEKHKSFNAAATYTAAIKAAANMTAASKEDTAGNQPNEEGLTPTQKVEIAALVALFLGYISEFNDRTQKQIINKVREMVQTGSPEKEIKKYIDDVFTGKEIIVIDNVGQERKEIYVDQKLNLSEVTVIITKPFHTTIDNYVELLAANAAHVAYEKGRKVHNISMGFSQWIFLGPADEIARPWHIVLIGSTYVYNSQQSEYAERCLNEPHCRHWASVYYGDPELDYPKEEFDKIKEKVGLFWNDELDRWDIH